MRIVEVHREDIQGVNNMVEFNISVFSCKGCPCLNNDYESGSSCNLEFECDLYWTKEGDLIYASTNCNLTCVQWVNDKRAGFEFIKNEPEMVTKIHPNHWEDE